MKTMNNRKKGAMIAGSLVATALMSISSLGAATSTGYTTLGTGSEIRTTLLKTGSTTGSSMELKCGADHKTTATQSKSKTKDAKCGQGKCGANKKASASKTKDASCGKKK